MRTIRAYNHTPFIYFTALGPPIPAHSRHSTPFSPPSGLATGSFNGLHTKSKFLAAKANS